MTGSVGSEKSSSAARAPTRLGEAANRLARLEFHPPDGVEWALAVANRNWLIHQYDEIDRRQTWLTLSADLRAWRSALAPFFAEAESSLDADVD